MRHDEGNGCGGGGGGGLPSSPRASVALTAKQWSAITFAVSHGVTAIKGSKTIPLAIISEALKDLKTAMDEIQTRLKAEAVRRGKT